MDLAEGSCSQELTHLIPSDVLRKSVKRGGGSSSRARGREPYALCSQRRVDERRSIREEDLIVVLNHHTVVDGFSCGKVTRGRTRGRVNHRLDYIQAPQGDPFLIARRLR